MLEADARESTERWFVRRGIPHFIEGYSASRDVLTRAAPALTLVFVVEIVANAPKQSFPIWLDVLAVLGALTLLAVAAVVVNHLRGRPPLARPDDIGSIEVVAFVVVPALVPLLFGGQYRSALVTAAVNVALLSGVYLGTSYGVVPMTRWAAGRLVRQLGDVAALLVRSLPLLALLVTFLFLTNEVWQTAGLLYGATYWITLAMFVLTGVVFLVVRLPRDVGELATFSSVEEIRALTAGTPTAAFPIETVPEAHPLGRRQWINVGLVALFSQGLQIVLVSLMIGGFFVMLGLLLVSPQTTELWANGHVHVLMSVHLDGRTLVVTEELLRVAGFLTVFAGLNFTVYLLTDATYRAEFREEVVSEIRQAFAVRARYLARVRT